MGFFWTIVVLIVTLGIAWRYLGSYMAAVFDGRVHYLAWAERPFYRLLGTSPDREQSWQRYAGSTVIFSGVFVAVGYLLLRIQGSLPLNPQHFGAVPQALGFNTIVSFMTNTNWQNYGGETTHVVLLPDRRAHRAAVRERRRRDRRGDRRDPGLRPAELSDHRQLLGRHHPLHALHPAPDRVRDRDRHGRDRARCRPSPAQ